MGIKSLICLFWKIVQGVRLRTLNEITGLGLNVE